MNQPGEFTWQVPADHPAFAGHFPGRPIVPGVLLVDQALRYAEQWLGRPVACWQLAQAKFLVPVGPGATVVFTLRSTPRGQLAWTAHSAGREVASGSLNPDQA